jgi:aminopeptidase N
MSNDSVKKYVLPIITDMAQNDPKSVVRAASITALGRLKKSEYRPLFLKAVDDSSYSIAGSALTALALIDTTSSLQFARTFAAQNVKGELEDAVTNVLYNYSGEEDFNSLAARFDNLAFGNAKFNILQPFANYLKRTNNPENFKKGLDMIVHFRDTIPQQYRQMLLPYFNGMILSGIASAKQSKGLTDQADYVRSKLPAKPKTNETASVPAESLQKYTGEYEMNG